MHTIGTMATHAGRRRLCHSRRSVHSLKNPLFAVSQPVGPGGRPMSIMASFCQMPHEPPKTLINGICHLVQLDLWCLILCILRVRLESFESDVSQRKPMHTIACAKARILALCALTLQTLLQTPSAPTGMCPAACTLPSPTC